MINFITKGAHQVVKILGVENTKMLGNSSHKRPIVKPAWPAEPTFSISMLLMGPCGRRRRIYYKARIFFFC